MKRVAILVRGGVAEILYNDGAIVSIIDLDELKEVGTSRERRDQIVSLAREGKVITADDAYELEVN
jgi:hypothetical protein